MDDMTELQLQRHTLADRVRSGDASRSECESYVSAMEGRRLWLKPSHEAADAFWKYWRENGETHHHGYYESTWGAINAAIEVAGLEPKERSDASSAGT